jgi:hypothetical protein
MRVIGGVMLSLLFLVSACGGNSASLVSEERWGAEFVREQVVCDGEGDLSLAFTLANVTASRGSNDLASASLNGRRLSDGCESAAPTEDVRESARWSEPIYEDAKLVCRVPRRVAIQVHPIMERSKPAGSVLLVLRADAGDLVASAPLKKGGSRLYYDTSLCTRSS